jgi:nuclear pore complex protein Nup43
MLHVPFCSVEFHIIPYGGIVPEFSRDKNIWLNSDVAKHHLEVFTLMPQLHKPVNSLDVNRSRVVCGCDNEAIYVFKNVVL